MRALPPAWKLLLACPALLPVAACNSVPETTEASTNIGVVSAGSTSTVPARGARPVAVVHTPQATATPHSLPDMRPRKAFVDPPLPAELLNDGDLRPLPPRPIQ